MNILTIINTIALSYLLFFNFKTLLKRITYKVERTSRKKTKLGIGFYFVTKLDYGCERLKRLLYIPFRNKEKTELEEEILEIIANYSDQQKRQTLTAKFSWLNNWEEVRRFQKNYSVVDRKIVQQLVDGFKKKNKQYGN